MTFDNFKVRIGYVRDPQVPRVKGAAKATIEVKSLKIEGSGGLLNKQFGFATVDGFSDDYFMVQADVDVGAVQSCATTVNADPKNPHPYPSPWEGEGNSGTLSGTAGCDGE